jgi:hypothetical protein
VVRRRDAREAARHLRERLALADPAARQGIDLGFGYLANTYFIGRYFGIVTPSTMGLDAWRLYETIRLTRDRRVRHRRSSSSACSGMVGLFMVILLFMPLAGRITHGQSFGELVAAMAPLIGATTVFGLLILLRRAWFRGLVALVPARLRRFAET